jgi:uncharacterized repeat protein (TIGR02543 family)
MKVTTMKTKNTYKPSLTRFLAAPLGIVALLLTLLPGVVNAQTTLYSQVFTGGSGADLHGTAVTGGTLAGSNWIAGTTFKQDGSAVTVSARTSAVLPFTPVAGNIYRVSANITLTSVSTTWLGLGFADNVAFTGLNNNTNRFAGAAIPGYSWVFTATNGQTYMQGPGTLNTATESVADTSNSVVQLMVELITTNANWSTKYYLSNVLVASGSYVGRVTNIDCVGFTTGNGLGTFSNFLVTAESFTSYTVTYNGNTSTGGTPPTDGVSPYVDGETVTVLGNTGGLTKSGYTFDGWNTAADGSGTDYVAANTFTMPAAGVTLYAQWLAAAGTITAPATFPVAISTLSGTASSSTSVAVSGSGLTGDITNTAPAGLEVSSDNVTFGNIATFTQSGGTASGTLYLRLAASAPVGSYNSLNVTLTSPGASDVNVATTASGNSVIDTAVWTSTTTPATWGTPGNWLNSVVGTNVNNTADFNQVNITADTTVNLTTPLTIGSLIFGDTVTGSAAGWIVANDSTPANILTLAGTAPAITVNALGAGKSVEISAVVDGTSGMSKGGPGELVLSGANTYTGATTVSNGTLTLSGPRTVAIGAITVGQDANLATLKISAGTLAFGANGLNVGTGMVGGITNGIVDQTGGDISFSSGLAVLVGGAGTSGSSGVYNLSAGSITGFSSGTRGVLLGVNADSKGVFNLSGTGNLDLSAGYLGIGRSDSTSAPHNTGGVFRQTAGTATINSLSMGSRSPGTNGNATLTLIGGTFTNRSITRFCNGTNDVATITIGGTADVTLGAFPTTRAADSTATITFDGGTIRPYTNSTTYMQVFGNAYLTTNGANFNVATNNDIAVAQLLGDAPAQAGVLTKAGAGMLTLNGVNTYSGGTTISEGILRIGFTGSIHNSAGITNNAVLEFNRTSTPLSVSNVISGTGTVLKIGADVLTLVGANTYSGGTTVSNGTLAVNGSLTSAANAVTVAGGTLGGTGTIAGPVTVGTNGILAPGTSVGTLTINNTLTLQGTNVMEIGRNGAVLTNDLVTGLTTVTYGGTLVVTNIGSSDLQVGDTFQLFAASTRSGSFTTIEYPSGYTFTDNLATSGSITVLTVPAPPTLNYTNLGSGVLEFSWTGGFKLQQQTNSLSVGLNTNWVDHPDLSNPVQVTNNPAIPTTFFRLISTP